jgi:hypothetical protein
MKKGKGKDEPKKAVKEKIELDASPETVRRYADAYQGDRLGIGRGDVLDKAIEWRGDLWVVTAVCYGPQENPDYKIVFVEAWRLTPADQYRKKNLDGDAQYAGHFVKYDGKDYAITYPQLHFINKGPGAKAADKVKPATIKACPSRHKSKANGSWYCKLADDGAYCISEVGPDVSAYECPHNFQYAPDIDRELPIPHRRKFFRITARQSVVAKLAEMNQAGNITDRSGPKKIVQLLGDDWVVAGGLGTGAGGEEQVELWRVVPRVDWKKRVKTYVQLCGRRDGSGFTDGYNGFGFELRGMDLVMTRPELTITLTPKELAAVHAKIEAYTAKHERKPKTKKTAPKVKDKAIKFVKMKPPPAPAARKHPLIPEKPKWTQTVLEDFR